MRYPDIKNRPYLFQFLMAIKHSFITMYVLALAIALKSILIDYNMYTSVSEICSFLTFAFFIITIYYLPINLYLLVIIQFTNILPFIMYSRLLVCIESIIFFLSSTIIGGLFIPINYMDIIITVIIVVVFSETLKIYLEHKHKKYYMARISIIKRSKKLYLINKEVDMFIIIFVFVFFTLVFFYWM